MKKLQTLLHPKKKRFNDFLFTNLSNPSETPANAHANADVDSQPEDETFIFAGSEDGKVLVWSVDEEFVDVEEGEEGCLLVGTYGGHTNRYVCAWSDVYRPRWLLIRRDDE